ncbi:hypothetical protein quinque_010587 [Culex quinquefasciatus]
MISPTTSLLQTSTDQDRFKRNSPFQQNHRLLISKAAATSTPRKDLNSTPFYKIDEPNVLWKISSAPLKSTMTRFSGQTAQTTSANNQELLDSIATEISDSGHLKY